MLGAVELRTLYLRPTDVPQTLAGPTATRVVDVCGLLHEAILRICALGWLDDREAADAHLAALVVAEIAVATSKALQLILPLDPRARRLADAILAAQPELHPELVDLYRAAGLSRRTGERLFKLETGLAPAQWRRLAGLSRSLEHLVEGGQMERAAALAGFRSRPAFSAAFTKTFGFTPKSVRRSGDRT
jgi:AraC-like DNA-binding protein